MALPLLMSSWLCELCTKLLNNFVSTSFFLPLFTCIWLFPVAAFSYVFPEAAATDSITLLCHIDMHFPFDNHIFVQLNSNQNLVYFFRFWILFFLLFSYLSNCIEFQHFHTAPSNCRLCSKNKLSSSWRELLFGEIYGIFRFYSHCGCRFSFVAFNFLGHCSLWPVSNRKICNQDYFESHTKHKESFTFRHRRRRHHHHNGQKISLKIDCYHNFGHTNYMLNTEMDSKQQHHCLYGRAFTN